MLKLHLKLFGILKYEEQCISKDFNFLTMVTFLISILIEYLYFFHINEAFFLTLIFYLEIFPTFQFAHLIALMYLKPGVTGNHF